ncbi:Hsp70 family protein [Arenimonas sp.]|uniref:Hsp70 family protein n=1 Tax=Arenimonas sp. TaxID=1872635 RepID=UPI0039E6BFE0
MIVGIDLGTTHSLIGIYEDSAPRLFPNAVGELLTPSVVSIGDDGGVLVGAGARDRLITHPGASVAAFKRWMGTNRSTQLGKRSFRPEELSALVLRSLLADAEAALGEKVREAVISVPAYFGDAQRKATRAAGELAGIKVERLINEPTAAALAYGLQERIDGSTFIVLDLGGGTFDVSILEIFDGVMQVHASAGDNHLGGEDFLKAMLEACCKDLEIDTRLLPRGNWPSCWPGSKSRRSS